MLVAEAGTKDAPFFGSGTLPRRNCKRFSDKRGKAIELQLKGLMAKPSTKPPKSETEKTTTSWRKMGILPS